MHQRGKKKGNEAARLARGLFASRLTCAVKHHPFSRGISEHRVVSRLAHGRSSISRPVAISLVSWGSLETSRGGVVRRIVTPRLSQEPRKPLCTPHPQAAAREPRFANRSPSTPRSACVRGSKEGLLHRRNLHWLTCPMTGFVCVQLIEDSRQFSWSGRDSCVVTGCSAQSACGTVLGSRYQKSVVSFEP